MVADFRKYVSMWFEDFCKEVVKALPGSKIETMDTRFWDAKLDWKGSKIRLEIERSGPQADRLSVNANGIYQTSFGVSLHASPSVDSVVHVIDTSIGRGRTASVVKDGFRLFE